MNRHGLLLVVGAMMLAVVGCQTSKRENYSDLEVAEQIDSVCGVHDENNYCWASFYIDVPVNGPQPLHDSVMVLVNREVHKMCEYCARFNDGPDEIAIFSQDEMFTNDGKRLLSHYMDKYRSLIEDSLWNTFGLKLKMEAQTAKYVTYGLEFFHCGASCGSEKYFFTFDKSDGHQVKEIISLDKLARFFNDHPEYNTIDDDPWSGRAGWQFSPDDDADKYNCGLIDDYFSVAVQGCGNHYLLLSIPYDQIFSYLSPEAQALVQRNEENKPMLPA